MQQARKQHENRASNFPILFDNASHQVASTSVLAALGHPLCGVRIHDHSQRPLFKELKLKSDVFVL